MNRLTFGLYKLKSNPFSGGHSYVGTKETLSIWGDMDFYLALLKGGKKRVIIGGKLAKNLVNLPSAHGHERC